MKKKKKMFHLFKPHVADFVAYFVFVLIFTLLNVKNINKPRQQLYVEINGKCGKQKSTRQPIRGQIH